MAMKPQNAAIKTGPKNVIANLNIGWTGPIKHADGINTQHAGIFEPCCKRMPFCLQPRENVMSDRCIVHVYKDNFTPSRPWQADIYWNHGEVWKSWCYGYRSKKRLLQHVDAMDSGDIAAVIH